MDSWCGGGQYVDSWSDGGSVDNWCGGGSVWTVGVAGVSM